MSPDADQPKESKKKKIDVFWMDDEDDREQFQQKEQAERRKANWQDIKDEDVLSQLGPREGFIGDSPSPEEEWAKEMQQFEREMRQRSRTGSFTERISNTALRRFMEEQQKGGTRGRISRILGNLFARIFGVIGRAGMPPSRKAPKKKRSKKTP